jgi:hypothetical protein
MTDEISRPVNEKLSELQTKVSDGVKAAASAISAAIEDGKKPGKPLETLSKMTREAPLGMLLAAFLIGRALAKRRW